jgi:threonine aldolase
MNMELDRRAFVSAAAVSVLASAALNTAAAAKQPARQVVDLSSDGIPLTALEYAAVLQQQCTAATAMDDYSRGGAVAALEQQFAALTGKEAAVFMPSGTLANHLAVRALAGNKRRAIVQSVSHLYNDSGDCVQQLSGITLLPVAPGKATFGWDEVAAVLDTNASGRVATPIGAISVESPVRRLRNEAVDFAALQQISREARKLGIGLHLDGARLFVAAAYSGRAPAEYTELFDTVYVSLWKCFNSANGAILAGPRRLLDDMFHLRRMFGGAMKHAWPDALVAAHYADGYLERMRTAVAVTEQLWKKLQQDGRFVVERVANGTSVIRVRIPDRDLQQVRKRLAAAAIVVDEHVGDGFWLRVNETANRMSADTLAGAFIAALG